MTINFIFIFWGLNVPEYGVKFQFFAVISIDLLLVYGNKYYLHLYLDNRAYKIVNKKMIDYLHELFFFWGVEGGGEVGGVDEDFLGFINVSYKFVLQSY